MKPQKKMVGSVVPSRAINAVHRHHNKDKGSIRMTSITTTDARTVAEYFIWKSQQADNPVTNKKLQKLLYYAQAWSLAIRNELMFKQDIEAWVHGPAIREVYMEYKTFGFKPITLEIDPKDIALDNDTKKFLDSVWNVYGNFDGDYLETLSHSEAPWQDARRGMEEDESSDTVIEPEAMLSFFSQKLQESKEK
jgi:uncharacterized phage-associated protein